MAEEEHTQRRQLAILVAEVGTSGRPVKRDEARTLAAFELCRKEVLDPLFTRYGGHVSRAVGDGVFVEFVSAVNAARCAIELQQGYGGPE